MSSRDWNVPIDLMEYYRRLMQSPTVPHVSLDYDIRPVWHAPAVEALRHMRDTTQSRDQYNRAVAALKAMGVDYE
jgi:hypothetical protein